SERSRTSTSKLSVVTSRTCGLACGGDIARSGMRWTGDCASACRLQARRRGCRALPGARARMIEAVETSPGQWARARCAAAFAAGICFALALAGFGSALTGYAQLHYPVALLGAAGVPRATAFNLLGFV